MWTLDESFKQPTIQPYKDTDNTSSFVHNIMYVIKHGLSEKYFIVTIDMLYLQQHF